MVTYIHFREWQKSSIMDKPQNHKSQPYQIKVLGSLDESWAEWFLGLSVKTEKDAQGNTVTTLSGQIIDQSELRGILIKLWNLNLSLLSVKQVDVE